MVSLYVCSLCTGCRPTRKNNIEQHVWQMHADAHRQQNLDAASRPIKYRASLHKAYVDRFCLRCGSKPTPGSWAAQLGAMNNSYLSDGSLEHYPGQGLGHGGGRDDAKQGLYGGAQEGMLRSYSAPDSADTSVYPRAGLRPGGRLPGGTDSVLRTSTLPGQPGGPAYAVSPGDWPAQHQGRAPQAMSLQHGYGAADPLLDLEASMLFSGTGDWTHVNDRGAQAPSGSASNSQGSVSFYAADNRPSPHNRPEMSPVGGVSPGVPQQIYPRSMQQPVHSSSGVYSQSQSNSTNSSRYTNELTSGAASAIQGSAFDRALVSGYSQMGSLLSESLASQCGQRLNQWHNPAGVHGPGSDNALLGIAGRGTLPPSMLNPPYVPQSGGGYMGNVPDGLAFAVGDAPAPALYPGLPDGSKAGGQPGYRNQGGRTSRDAPRPPQGNQSQRPIAAKLKPTPSSSIDYLNQWN